jgi:alpha-aminoadipic semialdehyde synthase
VERHTATLVEYADAAGHSAMSRTVGMTAAIGAQLILDGAVVARGVCEPTTAEFYGPMLDALEREGVAFKTTVKILRAPTAQAAGE